MAFDLVDIVRQYAMMISRKEKRRRASQSREVLDRVVARLRPGDLAFDCGANVGKVTGELAATGAEVHAFEPDPIAFAALSDRVGALPNVTLHNVAVGAAPGEAVLRRDAHFEKNPLGRTTRSTLIEGGRRIGTEENTVTVQVIDLPALLRQTIQRKGGIAFLKIDIEGAEVDLLEVMEREALFDHIDLTVVETHEKKFRKLRPRFRSLRKRLGSRYPLTRLNLDWN